MSGTNVSQSETEGDGGNPQSTSNDSPPDWLPEDCFEELNDKQQSIIRYLAQQTDKDGETYTRSKKIANAINLSSREVGTNLNIAREKIDFLSIEKWGRSNSTTWKISREVE